MICNNCKKEITDNETYCPYCGYSQTQEIGVEKPAQLPVANGGEKIILLIASLSVILSILPLSLVIIVLGVLLGLSSLIISIFQTTRKKHSLSTLTIIASAVGFASNISWLLFVMYML